jgi:hypothetical protein
LYSTPSGQILERNTHVVEINLSLDYPRRAPQCKMLTPIFHPNFDEVSVCIGDFWAASEGLDDLIVRIGRMIAYQEYNTKSPLNGLAAKWAAQNAQLLPVDNTEFAPPAESVESNGAAKLVVRFDQETSEASAAAEARGFESAGTEEAPAPVYGVPRLDFGMVSVALRPERTTVGRAPDNVIQLAHSSVSSHHAELIETEDGILLRDLHSTNGTTHHGAPVSETIVSAGARIRFGDVECLYWA